MDENELVHAGVKGMKWRETKGEDYDPKAAAKIKERETNQRYKARREAREAEKNNSDPKKIAEERKKKINEMTGAQVARAAKRMEFKKKYRERNKDKEKKGKKVAETVISTVSKVPKTSQTVSALSDIGSTYYKKINNYLSIT